MKSHVVKNEFGEVKEIIILDGFIGLELSHKTCQAQISLYGGQVLSWQPTGHKNVFWLSEDTSYQKGKAIRGGIPLCWPWFGAHINDPKNVAGNHGFARQQHWQVEAIDIDESNVNIILIWQGDDMHPLFSSPCQLRQILSIGKEFSQTLEMINLSDVDVKYTGALHSYFRVSDPKNISIKGLEKASFDDKLLALRCAPEASLNGLGPIDRVYHNDDVVLIVDDVWQRTIKIEPLNTKQWVFWNPGINLSKLLADIHENGEQEFVCLEAANTDIQTIPAQSKKIIGQKITVL